MSSEERYNSAESWDYAARYADILRTMPERLQTAVRELRKNQPESGDGLEGPVSYTSLSAVKIIYRAARFKVPIYFAASQLFPERFKAAEDDTEKALLTVLGPKLFATLLSLVWYRRRLAKLSSSDATESLVQDLLVNMEIGYLLGTAVPELGMADAIILGVVRFAALGTLLVGDAGTFQRYRNLHKGKFVPEFERERWGCDHAQISTYLLQGIGMPQTPAQSGKRRTPFEIRESMLGRLHDDAASDPLLILWMKAIRVFDAVHSGKGGDTALQALGVDATVASEFLSYAAEVLSNGTSFGWMLRGGEDE